MNKLILLLRKGTYSYEFMDDWETFNKTSLPEKKKEFYFNLNMVNITESDYNHAKEIY